MTRILVVDDEEQFPRLVRALLDDTYVVDVAIGAEQALHRLDQTVYDAVITDLHMPPGVDGIELLKHARARDVDAPFLVLTGRATVETAVQAMREGAYDYLRKPVTRDELAAAVERAVAHGRMEREVGRLRREVSSAVGDRPVGESGAMRRVMALAERVASSEASVLILGESGTGKELLARTIHRLSTRSGGPFVAFDCSALAPSLVESELFGHERGAFTGAQRARRGLFREASAGTLFLDEIGDVAPEVQNKLLRVLQEREIKPVGGDSFVKIDVRVLAATNKDLAKLIAQGRFREDLYYRLAVVPVELPPLRDRTEDLPVLVANILGRRRSAGPRPTRIAADALARLATYRWPGNIRELENVIERAAILSDGQSIRARDLPPLGSDGGGAPAGDGAIELKPLKELIAEATGRIERAAIVEALRQEAGSPSRAAKRLGISRSSLYNKLTAHGIAV
ncbi:MAG: sigma-54-dependent Fis family transcriptional regulator [Myxococcales bacterium]|nr:sigma-54-dependent Fis family transcriptional regulator [Myxococcales bacterium]